MASHSVPTEVRQKKWDKKSFEKIGEEIINFYTSPTGGNYSKKLTVEKFESDRPANWIYAILSRYDKRKCVYVKGARKGLNRTANTPQNMQRMVEILKRNPTISILRLARELNMAHATVVRMVKEYRGESKGGKTGVLEEEQLKSMSTDENIVLAESVMGSQTGSREASTTTAPALMTEDDDWDDGNDFHEDEPLPGLESSILQTFSGTPVHCFLCDSLDANVLDLSLPTSTTSSPMPAEFRRSMWVICFLKNILGMDNKDLMNMMEATDGRNPNDWGISVCSNPVCKGAVEKAFNLWKEIKRLEVQLRKRRRDILERLRRCWKMNGNVLDDQVLLQERVHNVLAKNKMVAETSEARVEPSSLDIKMEQELDDYNDDFDDYLVHGEESHEDVDIKNVEVKTEFSDDVGGDFRRKSTRARRKVDKFTLDKFSSLKPKRVSEDKRERREKLKEKLREIKLANKERLKLMKMKAKEKAKNASAKSKEILYSCKNCPQLEKMDQDKFIAHICFHAGHPSKCTECNLYFPKGSCDQTFQEHLAERHPEAQSFAGKIVEVPVDTGGMWLCPGRKCQGKFESAEERDEHLRAEHEALDTSMASCSICPSKFFNVTELRLHKAVEHPDEARHSCPYCDLQFDINSVKGDAKFLNIDKLKEHIQDKHPDRLDKYSRTAPPRFLQTCPLCGVVFCSVYYSLLDNHLAHVHNLKLYETYSCPICPKKMRHTDAWRHNKKRHLPGLADGNDRPFVCQFCGKDFRRRKNWNDHEQIHRNKDTRPFQCELCGSSFAVKTYLYIHRRVTHQHRPSPSALRKRKSKAKSQSSSDVTSAVPQSSKGGFNLNEGHDDARLSSFLI